MSYYTLPRKQNSGQLNPQFGSQLQPIISFSLLHYLSIAQEFIYAAKKEDNNNIDFFYKIINPYEFIHQRVPGSKFSVSKIKTSSPIFYTFMEIIHTFSIFESFQNRNIVSLHCGLNNLATIECMNIFRENNDDVNYEYITNQHSHYSLEMNTVKIDLLYFELFCDDSDVNTYSLEFAKTLRNILSYQGCGGISIIKIDTLFHKPILDIVYLLTSMYEKVYIIKPNTSTIFKNERFLVCKHFILDSSKIPEYTSMIQSLNIIVTECMTNNKYIYSLISDELPYYFLNKIEDANIIIGHLQLEQYDQLINLIKNKNRDDKIETFKKNNIQKCIQWCEKYKIPFNKFVDKLNIFLPIILDENKIEIEIEPETESENSLEL